MSSRVVKVRGRGGPEVLQVETRPVPQPAASEVLVRVAYCGVAYGDVMRRRGVLAPPTAFTPGYDVVGTVEAAGAGAEVPLGTRVAAFMPSTGFGGYAEHVVVPADRVAVVPEGLPLEIAAALGLNFITAWQLLTRFAPVAAGERVLVHGAAGGVGTAVLELARDRGVVAYGTASGRKHDRVRALGGIPIDYRSEDFVERMAALEPDGVQVVIDGIGGAHLRRSYATLAPGGTLVALGVSGAIDGGWLGVIAAQWPYLTLKLWPDGRAVKQYMISLSRGSGAAEIRDDWAQLMQLAAESRIAPAIGEIVPLSEVRRAHQLVDEAAVVGKVLLRV